MTVHALVSILFMYEFSQCGIQNFYFLLTRNILTKITEKYKKKSVRKILVI